MFDVVVVMKWFQSDILMMVMTMDIHMMTSLVFRHLQVSMLSVLLKLCNIHTQTDTTVVNPVISPKLNVARFTSTSLRSYDLHEIQLTQSDLLD